MEFKIDTKDNFSIITPDTVLIDANLADAVRGKIEEIRQSGSKNYILDLQHCHEIDPDALEDLLQLHEEVYSVEESLVLTGINTAIMNVFKEDETDLALNITPTLNEAVDIINMEILERDLLSEE